MTGGAGEKGSVAKVLRDLGGGSRCNGEVFGVALSMKGAHF